MKRRIQIRISDDERDLCRFYDERITDPMRRGAMTREVKMLIRNYLSQYDLKKNELTGYDCVRLANMNPDRMNDKELVWLVDLTDKISKHLKNNPNVKNRYFKFKQRTNL